MRGRTGLAVSLVIAAALALFGVSALAEEPPFPVQWQGVLAQVPVGTGDQATCTYSGKIYLFGGSYSEYDSAMNFHNFYISNVQIYDPALDAWTAGPDGTDIGAFASAVEAGGLVYVMGGMTSEAGAIVDSNRVYDLSSNTWKSNKKAMPAARRGHMACAANGKIYVFGGKDSSNNATDTVSIYDPATDSWSSGTTMPYKAVYGAAVWVPSKSRVYCIGGWDGGSVYYDKALTYDPTANAWDSTQISLLTATMNFACAFDPSRGKIGIFSGFSSNANGQFPLTQTQVLDTATNTVSEGALMPSPMARTDFAGACVNGKMYVIGGGNNSPTWYLADVYDVAADSWYEPTPKLPDLGFSGLSVAAVGGKVYALNGAGYNINDKVYVLDPAGGGWTATNGVNPKPRYYGASGVYNGKIIWTDGVDANGARKADTYLYDPATDIFTDLAPNPTPRGQLAGAVANGVFYVFGGIAGSALSTAEALDLTSNKWSAKKAMPKTIYSLCACAFGGKVYLFGGLLPGGTLYPGFYAYDPATDSYQDLGRMPKPIYAGACTVYGKYILVLGDSDGAPGLVQVYDPAANTWYTAHDLFDRDYAGVAVAAGKLYAVGGEKYYWPGDVVIDRTAIAWLSTLTAAPSANPASGGIPLAVSFSANATGGTEPYTYDWDFKDGSDHDTAENPSHTFAAKGTYDVALAVTDAEGATKVAHVRVEALLPPPVITAMKKSGNPFRFVVTGSNLQNGIQVAIGSDTTPWSSVTWGSATQVTIGGGKTLKTKVPKGTSTVFHFKNPDGGTADFTFGW